MIQEARLKTGIREYLDGLGILWGHENKNFKEYGAGDPPVFFPSRCEGVPGSKTSLWGPK